MTQNINNVVLTFNITSSSGSYSSFFIAITPFSYSAYNNDTKYQKFGVNINSISPLLVEVTLVSSLHCHYFL